MNFFYFKVLMYINKFPKLYWLDLSKKFNISKEETIEVNNYLRSNGYIKSVGDTYIKSTYKGKHFLLSTIFSVDNVNIINVLALVISLVALIVSIVAIVKT